MKNKILIITASEMKNMELAREFQTELDNRKIPHHLINLVELNLPLYTSRSEAQYKGEELLKNELPHLKAATGFIFISPEYNGGTPPVFNNFLAWVSRSSSDWREFLNSKPALIATFSGGGGFNVLQAMRTQLAFIGMNVMGRQILTHRNKLLDPASLQAVTTELVQLSTAR